MCVGVVYTSEWGLCIACRLLELFTHVYGNYDMTALCCATYAMVHIDTLFNLTL